MRPNRCHSISLVGAEVKLNAIRLITSETIINIKMIELHEIVLPRKRLKDWIPFMIEFMLANLLKTRAIKN